MSDESRALLRVEKAGPLALVVDGGRFGVRHLGVTQGGAADWVSFRWANWLLGNALEAAALEIVLGGGLMLEVEQDATLALAGADLDARLDDRPLAPGTAFPVSAGQRLSFYQPRDGLRAYLAVPGGLATPVVLGSRSATPREQLGGHRGDGSALSGGDRLAWNPQQARVRRLPFDPAQGITLRGNRLALVPGAQVGHFTGASLYHAFNATWRIDTRADRMGVRLLGPELHCRLGSMISEGIPLGAVQVPPDGQPIVLLNDRQTIGGYPRLGALTPLASARLAQCLPGKEVGLVATSREWALVSYRRCLEAFR
ncbi:biotin-dependent carboxyltransferase [Halomonas sp. MCCC 1A17488]|uniref:5-oxoprolinase subunit C family protein n=1 Tax=unclassified Halomonas TaxID=2609666 RepID=UPI0018D2588D|nr:biotin-dependent carboxyltransferase family protein [Halomonas sp. SS10-MC5]MCE8015208.1 biotin-dependent carboxyltransferase [Halomonas sp. MCCC 1A17488]MCG3238541.1 biotin-dependent carboxyltransferase [Halomonas sp. MCCC 1A17488]QPP47721.1 biotin-dependent carboxyltransferase [Halomonas sp. SS10-MC5]